MSRGADHFAFQVLRIAVIAALFATASWFSEAHRAALTALIKTAGMAGPLCFVLTTAAFVILVIPLDLVILVPLGVALWGPVPTALLSITGWAIGASVAFGLAQQYGRPMVARLIGAARVEAFASRVPVTDSFWGVVFLRMCVPVDLLSYALGLFGEIPWGRYVAATAIGVTPFGFYFAYAGTLPFWYQPAAIALAFVVVGAAFLMRRRIG